MELLPYTEAQRDAFEVQKAIEANKRELLERHSQGIQVIAYWLVKENVCTIFVRDERTNSSCEFPVANDEVSHWFEHPFAHKDAKFPEVRRTND